VIVVATGDFEVYHGVVSELRDRGVVFTTVELGAELPAQTELVITGIEEEPGVAGEQDVPIVRAEAGEPRVAVDAALAHLRTEDGRRIVGVDPGEKPGIAVLVGETVVAAFQVPLEDAAEVVRREVEDGVNPVVRIGDGSRLEGARIVEALEDVRVEVVDETGTTPHLGTGARGMDDVLAAVNIARLSGDATDSVAVEPTEGEIQRVQNRSRQQTGSQTLPAALARSVALGELTLEEAIAKHRDQSS
jgi:hypothetical protein